MTLASCEAKVIEPPEPKPDEVLVTVTETYEEAVNVPSGAQPEIEIAVNPEREEVAEREPERVPVEPETPDVAVPAKQPEHSTVDEIITEVEEHDISALRKLGAAVLVRAFEDARTDSRARQWFEQTPQPMLTFWCQVVGLDVVTVRKRARDEAGLMSSK